MGFTFSFLTWTKGKTHVLRAWALNHPHWTHLECSLNAGSSACSGAAEPKFLVNICLAVGLPWSRGARVGVPGGLPGEGAMETSLEG